MSKEFIRIINLDLKEYNSFRITSKAKDVYFPYSSEGVKQLFLEMEGYDPVILGNGTNTIFTNEVCIRPVIISTFLNNLSFDNNIITAGSGASLSILSWFALEKSRTGFEFLEDIPGTVGGALYMDAGTYEDTIGDRVVSVMVYDYNDKKIKKLTKEELASWWGKRNSYFQQHPCFIIQAEFDASNIGDYEGILDKMLETKKKRYMKQPRNYPSAGSVFKRPYVNGEPRYIWKLFDEAGLRGYRIGDAQVSEKHPGFIVNIGNASGKDAVDLMNYCKQVVLDKYGIRIEEEWRII